MRRVHTAAGRCSFPSTIRPRSWRGSTSRFSSPRRNTRSRGSIRPERCSSKDWFRSAASGGFSSAAPTRASAWRRCPTTEWKTGPRESFPSPTPSPFRPGSLLSFHPALTLHSAFMFHPALTLHQRGSGMARSSRRMKRVRRFRSTSQTRRR